MAVAKGLFQRLMFTIKTPRDHFAKEYKFVCESAQDFADWKAAIEEAAGKDANREVYPAANRPNLVALVNGKSGGIALLLNIYITCVCAYVCVCV